MMVFVLILHALISVVLIAAVLMQSGKGGSLAGAFGGGGGNQTLFGGRGAVDFLGKATWVLGGAFMMTSLLLALLQAGRGPSAGSGRSLIPKTSSTAPAIPGGEIPTDGTPGGGTPAGGAPAGVDPAAVPPAGADPVEPAPISPPSGN